MVISSVPPLDLLADKRMEVYRGLKLPSNSQGESVSSMAKSLELSN